ncbi:CaiB/BaiF CoA transferase family protein [Candidatus Poriferisodalis sp.]|uniref:CaiB/BaiF CoA transferase family protein n=1 Tax=Candidatus Poriferisodalis sp. TaxID=3101277 RepID=UPI003B025CBB
MLQHYRVLDLCQGISQFAGYLLASLGAEVIAVEPPGGVRSRHLGPFVDDEPDPERSLTHWAFNQGKRSVTADVAGDAGRRRLLELVRGADALIEDAPVGHLAALGLGYDELAAVNPAIVHASITPYGSTGPRSSWAGSDLTAVAGSGFLHASGDKDRAPVRVSGVPQSFLQAAGDAAAATLIALREAQRSGRGQHVDVSAMESMTHGQPQNLSPRVNANPIDRLAGGLSLGGIDVPMMFPCADGNTICVALMGVAFAPYTQRLVEWEAQEGFADEELQAVDWETVAHEVLSGQRSPEIIAKSFATHARFLATKSTDELWAAAFDRDLLITPSALVSDLLTNPHFAHRGFWRDVEFETGRTARFCGPLAGFSDDPPQRALTVPQLGADDDLIGAERRPYAAAVAERGVVPGSQAEPSNEGTLPLTGLKVVEFSWVIATPSAVRILADYGATVVKVETASRPDTMRTVNPFVDEDPHPDNSVGYGVYNAGKRSLSLDLSNPQARPVVEDLIRWADIVTESWAPGAAARMGFGYDDFSTINPGIIMLSSSLLGQTGPYSKLAGYGFMAAALAGFYEITGWPDRGPAGPYGPYTDFLAPRVIVAALMAALERRDRTGTGCCIDVSQTESALHYLAPAILDASINGRDPQRCGNDDPHLSPHGVYPSSGDDQWVAIACTDERWSALAAAVGLGDDGDSEGAVGWDQPERRSRAAQIDAAVSAWTAQRSTTEAAEALQSVGIDAYPVNNAQGCCDDPQLQAREHHIEVPQSHRGTMWTQNCRTRMSRTPAVVRRGGPCLGEDNYEVLTEFLGYEADRVADLAAAEVLG